jgi:hypothetical protein
MAWWQKSIPVKQGGLDEDPDLSRLYAHNTVEVGFVWEDKDGGMAYFKLLPPD